MRCEGATWTTSPTHFSYFRFSFNSPYSDPRFQYPSVITRVILQSAVISIHMHTWKQKGTIVRLTIVQWRCTQWRGILKVGCYSCRRKGLKRFIGSFTTTSPRLNFKVLSCSSLIETNHLDTTLRKNAYYAFKESH